MAKRSFFIKLSINTILGKIGGKASEEIILQLVRTKSMPVLLYRLESCPLRKSDCSSLDFVVNRFFMELFKTNNIDVVNYCHMQFNFELPSVTIAQRSRKFTDKYWLCDIALCKSFVFR